MHVPETKSRMCSLIDEMFLKRSRPSLYAMCTLVVIKNGVVQIILSDRLQKRSCEF
jgi:hypothetical protein